MNYVLIMISFLTLQNGPTEINSKAIQMANFEQCVEATQYVNHRAALPDNLTVYAFCKPVEDLKDYSNKGLMDFVK